jgi:hypothetical protein
MSAKTNHAARRSEEEPRVGIFWAIDGKPLIDATPLSEAEPYGDCLTHPRGHAAVWEQHQLSGIVPHDAEYEEFPRGRVMYNTKTQRYLFLADKCILKDAKLVRRILLELHLPRTTEKGADSHYRCSSCLHRWAD